MSSDPKFMSDQHKPVFFKYTADDLFFLAFNLNMGFLPPFITLASNKALQLPLILMAVQIYLRLLLRPRVLKRFTQTLGDANILLLLALIGLLIVNALVIGNAENDIVRILLKPGLVLLAMTILRYSISNRCELNQPLLGKYLLVGMIIGILLISSLSYWSETEFVQFLENRYGLVKVHKLNRALEILSILVFLIGIGVTSQLKSAVLAIVFATIIYVLSFNVVGSAFWSGTWHPNIHVDSETVQYGLPLAFIVFCAAHWFPKLMTNALFGGIGVMLLAAPWIYQVIYKILNSTIDQTMSIGLRKILIRGEIWETVAKKSLESPIFGFGIDSARYLKNIIISIPGKPPNTILHPHNMILQLWLDLGLIGVLIVAGLLYSGWQFVRKIQPSNQPAILGGLTMLTTFSMVSHSLWQTWSISLIAIFATLVSTLRPTRSGESLTI